MTEQQQHLKKAIDSQRELINDVNELNNSLNLKRESIMKYQGIIEYLIGNGVKLPESPELPETTEIQQEKIEE